MRKIRPEILARTENDADLSKNEQSLYQVALWEGRPVLPLEARMPGFGLCGKDILAH